jgi:hypothetical protein
LKLAEFLMKLQQLRNREGMKRVGTMLMEKSDDFSQLLDSYLRADSC